MTVLDTRTKLMDAAERAVRTSGADGFSYADLASEIGIRKASIHYHFPSKSNLLTAIMTRYANNVLKSLVDLQGTRETPEQRLLGFIDLYRDALNTGKTVCLCVAYTASQDGLDAETLHEIVTFRTAVLAWLSETLAETQLRETPESLLATVEGAQIAARLAQDLSAYDAATQPLRAALQPI